MIGSLRQQTSNFMHWWGTELASSLPRRVRSALLASESPVDVGLSPDGFTAELQRGRQDEARRFVEQTDDPEAAGKALAATLRKLRIRATRLIVKLSDDLVLDPIVEVPVDATANLREVLSAEIDRQTPFLADEVAYAFRVLNSDDQLETLKVQLQIAPKAEIKRASDFAKSAGLSLSKVSGGGRHNLNLLSAGQRVNKRRITSWLFPGLVVIIVGLGAIATVREFDQLETESTHLDAEIASLMEANKALAANLDSRRQTQDLQQTLVTRKIPEVTALGLLAEATRTISDDTWLMQFQLRQDRLVLTGFTRDSSALVRALEESSVFSDVQFSAPVTRQSGSDADRFHIIMTTTGAKE